MKRAAGGTLASFAIAGVVALGACHHAPPAPVADAQAAPPDASSSPIAEQGPRCRAIDPALVVDASVGDPASEPDLEIGDAIAGPFGIAVGVVHHTAAGRVAAVALLPADARSVRLRDLGPTLGDAPPPRLVPRGAGLMAVAYALPRRSATRSTIALYGVSAAGDVSPLGAVDEAPDDSLAVDATADRIVWDESVPGSAMRGVIRVAEISADGRTSAPRDASPESSDADTPRIVATRGGWLVFWIARRPDDSAPRDAAATDEVTAEAPEYAWLEVVRLDAKGVAGPVRRLTSATGHVSAYDVAAGPPGSGGAGGGGAIVVARDEGESVDGSGGSLLRVRVSDDAQDAPVAFPIEDLGRGAPSIVEGDSLWLSWTGAREDGRLLPLDAAATPLGAPSPEPTLDVGRPLLSLSLPSPQPAARLLAATPDDPTAQLRMLACTVR